ncbi:hypothetical protein [Orbus mooreae]|uniref:hypothetical protein n=1 Tax=Orbus mooreae TaxID=3074107 RepID=UPI00370DA001
MKPRQIKKNSKSAMDLLINFCGINPSNFSLDGDDGEWVVWSEASYDGDYDSYDTCSYLYQLITEFPRINYPFLDSYTGNYYGNETTLYRVKPKKGFSHEITVISGCRKLAKAGVKFR